MVVEVNCAYVHGWYEQIWLKSLPVVTNIKFCHSRQTNMTHVLDPFGTHMDQKDLVIDLTVAYWSNIQDKATIAHLTFFHVFISEFFDQLQKLPSGKMFHPLPEQELEVLAYCSLVQPHH